MELPHSEACERNKEPILGVLHGAFADCGRVLEVGSGTGQHAVHFAAALPGLTWQPTDLPEALPGLLARLRVEGPPNVLSPAPLDVLAEPWPFPVAGVDAVFTANTLHIVSTAHVEAFFRGVGQVLAPGGVLAVYGPFRYGGNFTTPSNAAFDGWLKRRDPASGIRDFERVDELAAARGLKLVADHAMPANNQLLIWHRPDSGTVN